jgi:hypothetical protein
VSGGEVQLGAGGSGDWCNPNKTPIEKYDLPGQGVTTAISALPGHAYTTTGYNASGDSMDAVNISDPPLPTPPVVTSGGSYNNFKTYGIYANTNNIFLASNHPNLTVDVTNASSPYVQKATFNGSKGGEGNSVFVVGNTGYVAAGKYLYAFNTSNISGSLPQLGVIELTSTGNKVTVVGSYAYVATNYDSSAGNPGQLQIINVSNPSNMSLVSTVNEGNDQSGVDVFVNSTASYAYLVTGYVSGKPDFYIIDLTNKNSPVVKGNYTTNGMNPTGVTVVSGNHAIIVGTGGSPYQVLNVSNVTSPTYCMPQGFSLSGVTGINAIASVIESDGDAFSYILTNDSNNEFQIIQGGPGGQFTTSGTFESQTFDATTEATFNSFKATTTIPSQTSLQFRIAIKHASNNSCTGVVFADTDFIGSDGTSSSYFPSTGGNIPLNTNGSGFVNPGRCMRYRAYFSSTDTTQTPVLYDISFNYSL